MVIFITILLTKLFADQRGVQFEDAHFEGMYTQKIRKSCTSYRYIICTDNVMYYIMPVCVHSY